MHLESKSALELFADRLASLSVMSPQDYQSILGLAGRVSQARANLDIISPGQAADHACLVVQGLLGRFGQLRDGTRQITALHIPGDVANFHSVAVPGAASAMQALSTTTIILLPHAELRRIAAASPAIANAFWAYSAIDAAILAEWTINVGRRTAQARLAHLLCEFGLRMEQAGQGARESFTLEATQVQLGDALGLTSIHVSRTFKALRNEKVIAVDGRTIQILNWTELTRLGDFDPAYLQLLTPRQKAA
jgi:CRP-like cAMP-binding protein